MLIADCSSTPNIFHLKCLSISTLTSLFSMKKKETIKKTVTQFPYKWIACQRMSEAQEQEQKNSRCISQFKCKYLMFFSWKLFFLLLTFYWTLLFSRKDKQKNTNTLLLLRSEVDRAGFFFSATPSTTHTRTHFEYNQPGQQHMNVWHKHCPHSETKSSRRPVTSNSMVCVSAAL